MTRADADVPAVRQTVHGGGGEALLHSLQDRVVAFRYQQEKTIVLGIIHSLGQNSRLLGAIPPQSHIVEFRSRR